MLVGAADSSVDIRYDGHSRRDGGGFRDGMSSHGLAPPLPLAEEADAPRAMRSIVPSAAGEGSFHAGTSSVILTIPTRRHPHPSPPPQAGEGAQPDAAATCTPYAMALLTRRRGTASSRSNHRVQSHHTLDVRHRKQFQLRRRFFQQSGLRRPPRIIPIILKVRIGCEADDVHLDGAIRISKPPLQTSVELRQERQDVGWIERKRNPSNLILSIGAS
jgi:hypothetical protein